MIVLLVRIGSPLLASGRFTALRNRAERRRTVGLPRGIDKHPAYAVRAPSNKFPRARKWKNTYSFTLGADVCCS